MGCKCGPLESDPCRSAFRQALLDTMNALNLTALVHPTWGAFAPGLEEDPADSGAGNYSPMIAPLTGAPAVSVPMGFGSQGLPAGLTFLGRPGDDDSVLGAALAYESLSRRREAPPLFGECAVH
ncbi:hypothetical protein H632_c1468p1 [Helicosporidium sp. ATCC 50920]|nr:hypothetical protein H632_c1468p1 [Helicosporidium sp. ATCC 50920]|eukprot:KDD74235.1 hypothetical protein H632_c1468p1 [Helicosporidium sp. ATCC 50920]